MLGLELTMAGSGVLVCQEKERQERVDWVDLGLSLWRLYTGEYMMLPT